MGTEVTLQIPSGVNSVAHAWLADKLLCRRQVSSKVSISELNELGWGEVAELEGCFMNITQDHPTTVPKQYVTCFHSNYLRLFPDRKEEGRIFQAPP